LTKSYHNIKLVGEPDRLFDTNNYPHPFEFNREVAGVFDDMAVRSIPGYVTVIEAVCEWAARCYRSGSVIYDLGCSTGTTSAAILHHIPSARVTGVDESEPMLERARTKLMPEILDGRFETLCSPLEQIQLKNASFAVLNYTLQFLPVSQRLPLVQKVAGGLNRGGVLFISEKTRSSCPEFQEINISLYERFKSQSGYSASEIERKKEALDRVLVPLSLVELTQLLEEAGFYSTEVVYAAHQFISLVAIKK
jgi:tRNA (cmo5U34)-methyltransferase